MDFVIGKFKLKIELVLAQASKERITTMSNFNFSNYLTIVFWIIGGLCSAICFFKYKKYNRYADNFKNVYPDNKDTEIKESKACASTSKENDSEELQK